MTNYERIKGMSVEEMAVMLSKMCTIAEDCPHCPFYDDCPEGETDYIWEQWLEQEAESDDR